MAGSSDDDPPWTPDERFPTEPEFYRRVLHFMPTPLIVVDQDAEIVYANNAVLELGGWDVETERDVNVLNHVHPEDRDALAKSFVDIVNSPNARIFGGRPWAEIYFRIITADGSILPIELIGSGGLMDSAVGGIIYEVRPARTRNLLGRVLDGLSKGASMHQLLSLVGEMIASPPLDLDAVIMQSTPGNGLLIAAATSPALSEILQGHLADMPWNSLTKLPTFVEIGSLPPDLSSRLRLAGYNDLWHLAVESPLTATTLRLVAGSPTHHVPANGPKNRLIRARELAAAVLLRSQADVLLDYAAARDRLTDLPNRAAFYQYAESCDPLSERAAIHLDLDGLKRVNNELGSAVGDAVLQVIADRLRVTCSPNDVIGRVGDDEFSILVDSTGSASGLMKPSLELAAEILEAVSDTIVVAGVPLEMTTSVGVAVAGSGISTDHLLTWADAAMHDAKRRGGGQICRYGVTFG